MKNPETGGYLEIDFSVPKYNLGFEFQDAHHYVTTWYYQVPLDYVEHRDNIYSSIFIFIFIFDSFFLNVYHTLLFLIHLNSQAGAHAIARRNSHTSALLVGWRIK